MLTVQMKQDKIPVIEWRVAMITIIGKLPDSDKVHNGKTCVCFVLGCKYSIAYSEGYMEGVYEKIF